MHYNVYMRTTITVRADQDLREALAGRAALEGKTISAIVREILQEALAERALGDRAAHLRGKLAIEGDNDEWRGRLRERNWRP